jgi:hypothetical protein
MKIKKIDGLTAKEIQEEVSKGGKFVIYQYCISIIVMTFKRPSDIYFIRHDQNPVMAGLKYSAISLFLGWWGIPWGPIYTIGSFGRNFGGGKDLTHQVNASLTSHLPSDDASVNLLPDYSN